MSWGHRRGAEKGGDDPRLQHSLEIFVEMSLIRREKRERESYFLIFFEERKINNLPSEDSKVSNLTDWGKKVSGRIEGENEGEKKGGGMEKSERKLTLFPIREWRVRLNIHNIGVSEETWTVHCFFLSIFFPPFSYSGSPHIVVRRVLEWQIAWEKGDGRR